MVRPVKLLSACSVLKRILMVLLAAAICPDQADAIQLHAGGGGIITHQMGHLFFLFSMIVLIFTIRGKALDKVKGWRFIQYAAFFFVLWNLDALTAHFLDNQIQVVRTQTLDFRSMLIETNTDSKTLVWVYYVLKLDHLLCVPAMLFMYMGVSGLVNDHQAQGNSVS